MSEGSIEVAVMLPAIGLAQLEERIVRSVLTNLPEAGSPWMNLEAAARYLDWPQKRVYNLVACNEILHRKQGGRLLFRRGELDIWLDLHYQGPTDFAP
jgi:hypothetical protein